jgi:hypothetical protein
MADNIIVSPVVNQVTVAPVVYSVTVTAPGPQGATGATGVAGLTPVFSRQDVLTPYVGGSRFYFDTARTITTIRASVGTPSVGAPVVVTVYKNGATFGTVSIPAGSNTATTTVNASVAVNDYVTVSIISVGSTTAGSDLTVILNIN